VADTARDEALTSPSPQALLERLQALASAQARPLPGGQALHLKLSRGGAPAAAWLRLAHAVHADWLKGQEQAAADMQSLFIDAATLAWSGLGDSERLRSGLYPAVIRALGATGSDEALASLVPRLSPFGCDDEAEHALAALLRQLRQHRQFQPLKDLLQALRPAWRPGRAWGPPLLAGVLALAREADDFGALQAAATWLPDLLDAAQADAQTDAASWRELGKLALRSLQVGAMQRVAMALLRDGGLADADTQPLLIQLLGLLATFAPDATTRALLADAAAQPPQHAAIQLALARIAHAEGASLGELDTLLNGVDAAQPGGATAMSWLAGTRFHNGDDAGARTLYEQLAAQQSLSAADRLRLGHLRARDDAASPDAPPPDAPAPATEAPPAWPPEIVEPFMPALAPLIALLEIAPLHDSPARPEDLDQSAAAACEHWRTALPELTGVTMQACLQLGRHLAQLEAAAFASHSQWIAAFPFPLGPAYGRIDPVRCRTLSRALHQHVVALADFALARPRALHGAPGHASLRQALDLAELRCEARWALGETAAALSDIEALGCRLGAMGEAPRRELQARALLTLGRLDEVRSLLAPPADEVLPLADWGDWLAAEGLSPQTLVDDASLAGSFESVQGDGAIQRHPHQLAATRLEVLHHTDLRVRNSHVLIGPRAGILRPGPWHLSMGDYPYEHRHVRLRGGGLRAGGAVLRAAHWQRVTTPVVVLANMDATYHRNYYHWMLLLLTRIEALRARGLLLGGRKLLLPRELSGWMLSSLAALGLGEEHLLLYGVDDDLQLTDALLASPIDFASPSLAEGLRQALWRHAGLDPAAAPAATRLLYISRRGEGRRPLVEEARIERAAMAMGFEAVAPETLTLAEQVRLFASARGIAGPPGAAYTNLVWAGPGTRVLSIFKEEANLPTFIDLSIIRGQSHRWLLGRNLAGFALMSSVNAPFSVDVALAVRELGWVAQAGAAPEASE
jgi:capsular polysaccharide biosynthesis protein